MVFKCYAYKNFRFFVEKFALLKENFQTFNFSKQILLIYHRFLRDIFLLNLNTFFISSKKCYQPIKTLFCSQLSIIDELLDLIT